MDDNSVLQFADQSVTFEKFVDLLATKVALRMHQVEKGQMEVSQAEAYRLFGRADVERWKKKWQVATLQNISRQKAI